MYQDRNVRPSRFTSVLSDPDPDESYLWDTRALDTRAIRAELDEERDLDREFDDEEDLEPLDLPYPSGTNGFVDRYETFEDETFVAAPRPRMAAAIDVEPPPAPVRELRTAPWEEPRSKDGPRSKASAPPPPLPDQPLPDPFPVPERRPASARRRRDVTARRARWREDMVTGLLSIALSAGLFLDGWNHLNLLGDNNGPFLTAWHGLLYLAFAANALYSLTRNQGRGTWSPAAIPPGYRLGAVGLLLGFVALVGDAFWHTLFGEEQGLSRLISPFHLVLFLSLFLLATSSFRSRWLAPTPRRVKRLQSFLPTLCSAIAGTSLVAFYVQYSSPLVGWARPGAEALPNDVPFGELLQIDGVMCVVVMNLVLVAPMLLILKRWHPPFGTMTWLFGAVGVMMAGLTEFTQLGAVVATLSGGFVADLLIRYWRSGERRPVDNHVVAAVVPLALWTAHYLSLAFTGQAPNEVTVVFGAIALASVSSVGLSMLMNAPPVPIPMMGDRTGELPPPPRAEDFSPSWEAGGFS